MQKQNKMASNAKLLDPLSYGLDDLFDVEVKGVDNRKDGNYTLKWSREKDAFSVVPLPASKEGGNTKLVELEDCGQIENLVNASNERPIDTQFQPLEFIPRPMEEAPSTYVTMEELPESELDTTAIDAESLLFQLFFIDFKKLK